MKLFLRVVQSFLACSASLCMWGVQAQTFPNKPIRIVVPFAPGGNVDVTARVISAAMTKNLNQTVFVENKTGAGGKIGADAAMRSAADGYTVMMGSNSSLSVAPNLYADWPYDPLTGMAPISHLASVPFVLITRPGLGAKSMADLLRLAKQKPGGLTMASAGSGTSNHLVGEFFQSVTGTSFLHVPYKGAGPALLDIMAGRVDILFDQVSSSSNYIEQGKVTALAVSSAARWKSLANVPTFAESGLQGFVITNFTGLVAPKGTPADVLEKLNRAANEALQDDAVKKSFATMGVEAVGSSPQQFSALIKDDLQRWAALIKDKGIKLD